MSKYNVVMEMSDSTVVTEYEPLKKKSDAYQSEAALEKEFIRMLTEQGYDYLEIHDSETLIKNLRTQLEIVNNYKFTDSEWDRFFNTSIANSNDGIANNTTAKIGPNTLPCCAKDKPIPNVMILKVPWKKLSPIPANGPIKLVLIIEMDPVRKSPSSELAFCSSIEATRPIINGVI